MGAPLRVGMVGCGAIAFKKHMPALAKRQDAKLVAFCDAKGQNAEKAREDYGACGARVYETPGALFVSGEVDAVCICTPNDLHASLSIEAMAAGLHVLCEKPMAAGYAEARRMVEAAKKNRRVLYIGYQNRYTDEAIFLRRLQDEGYFGHIYHVKAHAMRKRAVPSHSAELGRESGDGGPLADIGSHVIDLALWLTGNARPALMLGTTGRHMAQRGSDANYFGPWAPAAFKVEDSAFALVTMEDGMSMSLSASWATNTVDEREGKVSLYGDAASAEMLDELVLTEEKAGRLCHVYPVMAQKARPLSPGILGETPGDREMDAFLRAVHEEDWQREDGSRTLVTAGIIEGIYRSAREGRAVTMAEMTNP